MIHLHMNGKVMNVVFHRVVPSSVFGGPRLLLRFCRRARRRLYEKMTFK